MVCLYLYWRKIGFDKVVIQLLSRVQLFATPWTAARQDFLSFTISRSLFKLMSIEWVMPFSYLILCSSLLLLLSNFPSIRVLFNELALCIRWLMYWSFSFSIVLPMNIQGWSSFGLTGLISLLIKGLSIVFSSTTVWKQILWCSALFMVQFSHPYMTTKKTP